MEIKLSGLEKHLSPQDKAAGLAQLVAMRAVEHLTGRVKDRNVLDLACGEGELSRWLAVHGAHVTGVDSSTQAVEVAREREAAEPHGINYMVGDAEDLYMIDDSAFDVVICHLGLERIESLSAVIAEIARIICLGGRFIFSVGHPCFEPRILSEMGNETEFNHNYFTEEQRQGFQGIVKHRTLAAYINAVAARGFTVRRVMEPTAEEQDVRNQPEFADWRLTPIALAVEAVFPHL